MIKQINPMDQTDLSRIPDKANKEMKISLFPKQLGYVKKHVFLRIKKESLL